MFHESGVNANSTPTFHDISFFFFYDYVHENKMHDAGRYYF